MKLPPLKVGDTRMVKSTAVKEDATTPPPQHNDASLLKAMETAGKELEDEELAAQMKGSGIGTPATRAAIIERLIQVGYAERKGKSLLATDKGVQLIGIMPQEIASPEMTGRWELALDRITDGRQDAEQFLQSIRRFSEFLVDYAAHKGPAVQFDDPKRRKQRAKGLTARGTKVEGCKCPVCGKGSVLENERSFFCSRLSDGCHFTLWKDCLTRGGGPELNVAIIKILLKNRQVRGSTGTVTMNEQAVAFYPAGSDAPSSVRPLVYEKK